MILGPARETLTRHWDESASVFRRAGCTVEVMISSISFSTAVTQYPANWWSKHPLSSIENEGIAANPFSFCYAFIGTENDPLQRRFLHVASNLCTISITREQKSGKYIYVLEMRFLSLLWVLKSFWYLKATKTSKRVMYTLKRKHMRSHGLPSKATNSILLIIYLQIHKTMECSVRKATLAFSFVKIIATRSGKCDDDDDQ